jgi:integrase
VSGSVADFVEAQRAKGIKDSSLTTLGYRLRGVLKFHERDIELTRLTPTLARTLWERRTEVTRPDTQAGELAAVLAFGAYCVERGWLPASPFEGCEMRGRKSRGKPSLRIDEARRLRDVALGEGSREGLAVALALLTGMRASEITGRVVRDLDDGGRVIWIDKAKTKAGDRALELPDELRDRLVELAAGKAPTDPLWGEVDRHWLGYHVRRLCRVAGVPIVTPHGLRATWASVAAQVQPVAAVAAALGHVGPAITRRHYLAEGAEQAGQQRAALRVLRGGAA